jgi:hypothetical protein
MSGLSERTARLLASEREALHGIHARVGRGLEPEQVYAFVRRTLDPLMAGMTPEPRGDTLRALFELGLVGMQRGLFGREAASPFERALVRCLPRFGRLAVDEPRALVRRLGNAYARLDRELSPERALAWIEGLAALGPEIASIDEVADFGLVLAWRAGLVEARQAALEVASRLPARTRTALLGCAEVDLDPLARFCRPGHARPLGPLAEMGTAGGFVGFGGPFLRPPTLMATADGIVATSAELGFVLHADVYGARWVRSPQLPSEPSVEPQPVLGARGSIEWRGHRIADPRYARALSIAAHDGVLALSLPDSHRVVVIGHREGG